jgi:hypothetical protein
MTFLEERQRQPLSQTSRTFLQNHIGQIVAADFFVVPTAAWTAQQLREAFPWGRGASRSATRSRSCVRQPAGHREGDGNRGSAHGFPRALAKSIRSNDHHC